PGAGEVLAQARPQGSAPAVLPVLVEAGAAAAPGAAELVDHAVDDGLGGVRGPGAARVLDGPPVLLPDPARQGEGQLVHQGQHLGRITDLRCGLLDGGGFDSLADHGDALVDEVADDAGGEEAAGVVDDDRRLADLADQVEGAGQRLLTGALALDDLDQRHLVDRREEVQADEVVLALDAFGEGGDG